MVVVSNLELWLVFTYYFLPISAAAEELITIGLYSKLAASSHLVSKMVYCYDTIDYLDDFRR